MNLPPSTSAAPPAAPKKRTPILPIALGCLGVAALGCVAILGFGWWIDNQRKAAYAAGHEAYLAGDCTRAISSFDEVLDSDSDLNSEEAQKASAERQECADFQAAAGSQVAGRHGEALLAYSQFQDSYPDSPLSGKVLDQAAVLFSEAAPDAIANAVVCQEADALAQRGLIPDPAANLPPLLFACGAQYEAAQQFTEAIAVYERVRQEFADHPVAQQVDEALARTILAEAQTFGAGALPAPQSLGGTGTGPAVVIIQNDSPERLSLVFNGAELRVETLEPCASCQNYTGDGPDACPEQGPIGTYTVPPGDYEVVVRSLSDTSVSPFRGNWSLASGDEYYSCFFLVSR